LAIEGLPVRDWFSISYFIRKFRTALTDLGFGNEYQLYSWKHAGLGQADIL
jgi:tetrahydromethanopterin S-methyltransferase subunit E